MKAAVLELPRDQREDLEEEWLAELQALLDRPRKAIAFSRGLATAARGIAHESAPDSRPISERAPTFNAEAITAYRKAMIKRREFEQAWRAQIIETAYKRGVIDLPAAADAFALVRDRDCEPARLNAKLDELDDLTWRT